MFESGVDESARTEVVDILRDLIRFDTSNYGDGTGPGEAACAEYVEAAMADAGLEAERFSTTSSHRQGVVARVSGTDATRPALLLHAHLDVVPAVADDWSVPPFAAEVMDGMVWGRGAVDMKDSAAMILATLKAWGRTGARPERDIVVMFTPDEEAGGHHGAEWIIANRPELFEGATEGVGEVGGFSLTVRDDLRLYTVQVAEKGLEWMRLRTSGLPGHGSFLNDDNAVTTLVDAVARVAHHRFPLTLTPTMQAFVARLSEVLGIELSLTDSEELVAQLGPIARVIGATLQNTANPTMLSAGYKVNVIPERAEACIDGRFLPGHHDDFIATIDELLGPDVVRETISSQVALETTFDGPTVDLMAQALREVDPAAQTIPYMLSGGTDSKHFARLGIRCFGFVPLRLPPTLDFGSLFHGIDERVPIDAVQFGVDVLDRFLRRA